MGRWTVPCQRPRSRRIAVDASPRIELLPLRLFLGVTFVFAGLQKLADRRFFDAKAPTPIAAQLSAAAHSSPIGDILRAAIPHATALGVVIAVADILVGTSTLLGMGTRAAAMP